MPRKASTYWSRPSSPFRSSPGATPASGSAYVFPAPIRTSSDIHHSSNSSSKVTIKAGNPQASGGSAAADPVRNGRGPTTLQRNQSGSQQGSGSGSHIHTPRALYRRTRSFSEESTGNKNAYDDAGVGSHPGQTSKPLPTAPAADDLATSRGPAPPHLRFHVDDAIHELLTSHHPQKGSKSKGFSIISSLFSCLMNPTSSNAPSRFPSKSSQYDHSNPNPSSNGGGSAKPRNDVDVATSGRVAELLEISKKQQSELADKQDTIDMLEWQLEQLQAMALAAEEKGLINAVAPGPASEKSSASRSRSAAAVVGSAHGSEIVTDCHCNVKECISDSPDENAGNTRATGQGDGMSVHDGEEDGQCRGEEDGASVREFEDHKAGLGHNCKESVANVGGDDTSVHVKPAASTSAAKIKSGEDPLSHKFGGVMRYSNCNNVESNVALFEMATMRTRLSIRSLSKALIKQMEASGYAVSRALSELEPGIVFARKEHVVYALESRINRAFFHCFENDSFDDSGIMQILDPAARCGARLQEFQKMKLVEVEDAVNVGHAQFEPEFRRFCQRKTKQLWSQFTWQIFFNSAEEREAFTSSFLEASKCVWLLHRLAFSIHPNVTILRVGKGLEVDPLYVEAVPHLDHQARGHDRPMLPCPTCSKSKVEFLIMPGFQALDKLLVKCLVYPHIRCSLP